MSANAATTGRFHGVYASTVCPMQADGTIDENELGRHLSAVFEERGLRGLLVNGHAGENAVLTRAEQRRVIEIARDIGTGRLIVAGINAESSDLAALLPTTPPRRAPTRSWSLRPSHGRSGPIRV